MRVAFQKFEVKPWPSGLDTVDWKDGGQVLKTLVGFELLIANEYIHNACLHTHTLVCIHHTWQHEP